MCNYNESEYLKKFGKRLIELRGQKIYKKYVTQ